MEQKKKKKKDSHDMYICLQHSPVLLKHVFALEKSVQPGKCTELPAPPVTSVLLSGMLHIKSKVLKRFQSIQNKIKMECSFDFFFFNADLSQCAKLFSQWLCFHHSEN